MTISKQLEESLTPKAIVAELDKYIISQDDAKRAIAIALRNRWRRSQLDEELRQEVKPKNILFIGPTGSGKTEIARRLADFVGAPFIKVEATKFTEVGYVGRDVESIIRDLVDIAIKKARETEMKKVHEKAFNIAVEKVLDALLPPSHMQSFTPNLNNLVATDEPESATRKLYREQLLDGRLDNKKVEVEVLPTKVGVEIMGPPGMEEMTGQLQNILSGLSGKNKKKKKMRVKDALKRISEEEAAGMLNEEEIKTNALKQVEQQGIVFIDEIDKVVEGQGRHVGGPSREGVQRDLLPLVEGSTVVTKYGMVKTDHILFIASGAFHLAKPSDLVPELQGRLPIRVELKALTANDFVKILTEPKASLTEQYTALLNTEQVKLKFTSTAIKELAKIAFQVNERTENIGARRLHTIMERLLEDISFKAPSMAKSKRNITIDATYVKKQLQKLADDEDLSRSIL